MTLNSVASIFWLEKEVGFVFLSASAVPAGEGGRFLRIKLT